MQHNAAAYSIKCRAKKLSRKDTFGLSDPFLTVTRADGVVIMSTEVKMSTLKPNWEAFTLEMRDTRGLDEMLTFKVIDWDKDGSHDFIGSMQSNIRSLMHNLGEEIALKGDKQKSCGYLIFQSVDPASSTPPPAAVRIKFSAKGLPRMDKMGLGKSDPFVEIYGILAGQTRKILLAKTCYVENESNPVWEEIVLQVHNLERGIDTPVEVRVTDFDFDGTHDYIGSVNLTLRTLGFPGQKFPLRNPSKSERLFYKNSGLISAIVRDGPADYTEPTIWKYSLTCHGKKLDRKDMMGLGKSDPYFVITRASDGVEIYRSEIIRAKLNPEWKPFELTVEACQGLDGILTITVWDWDKITKDDLIGEFKTSLRSLSFYPKNPDFRLVNLGKLSNLTYRNSGFFRVREMIPHRNPQMQMNGPQRNAMMGSNYGASMGGSYYGSQSAGGAPTQTALYPSSGDSSQPCQTALYPTMLDQQSNGSGNASHLSGHLAFPAPTSLPPPGSAQSQYQQYHQQQPSQHRDDPPTYPSQYQSSSSNKPLPAYLSGTSSLGGSSSASYQGNQYQHQPHQYSSPNSVHHQSPSPSYQSNYQQSNYQQPQQSQGNLPSYITGISSTASPSGQSAQDLYGSSHTYSVNKPPAYLSQRK